MATVQKKLHGVSTIGNGSESKQQGTLESLSFFSKFLPHGRMIRMTQEAKGVFVPYPLLGIILTLSIILVSGIIALEVQVSNLNTTILLRDADQRAAVHDIQEKLAQHEVYIHDDREKLIENRSDIKHLQEKRK